MYKRICESLLQRASGTLADLNGMVLVQKRPVTDKSVQECAVTMGKLLTEFNYTVTDAGLVRKEHELVARAQWLNARLSELKVPV